MPFLTRNAVCLVLVAMCATCEGRRSLAEDGLTIVRIPSASKILNEDLFQFDFVDSIPAPPPNLLKFAVKLRAKNTRSALASGVNTADGIVTCAHVVDGYSEFTVDCDGESATAKIVNVDNSRDLALLSVTWSNPHSEAVLTDTNPAPDEELTSVGRQKDGTVTVERHSLHKIENSEYLYSNPPQEGRSGSGVFNAEGKLVGIVLGKIVDVEPYIGRAATVEDVAKLVKTSGSKTKVASGRGVIVGPTSP